MLSVSEVSDGLWDEGDTRVKHVREQELSGMCVADYCRRHDLRPATFYGWRRLRRERGPGRIAAAVGFTEVVRVGSLGASWAAEVALPSGAVVRVGAGADARLLRAVFEALG